MVHYAAIALGGALGVFSLESVLLMQHGQVITALTYIVLSVVTCLIACWLGISVTRTLII